VEVKIVFFLVSDTSCQGLDGLYKYMINTYIKVACTEFLMMNT